MSAFRPLCALAARFLRDRRGSVALMLAITLIPLIGAVGIAMDGARLWILQARLMTSVDAAVLAGARNMNIGAVARDQEMLDLFWINFDFRGLTGINPLDKLGFMGSTARDPTIQWSETDPNVIAMTATASIPRTFSIVFSLPPFNQPRDLVATASASARRTDQGMEVALVLDVTGSMGSNFTSAGALNGGTNIAALRVAATDLVNILFGPRETVENLHVAVVPYTTTVNVGRQRESFLEPFSELPFAPSQWGGCIEARYENGMDENDDPPGSGPGSLFNRYFWASTLQPDGTQRRTPAGAVIPGDNDWVPELAGVSSNPFAITEQWRDARENFSVGPNLGCPETPILSLSPSRSAVLASVASLRATFRGGTMANVGLQFGWATLSPRWRGLWGDPTPPNRPVDYGTPFTDKVIVLMTDGANNWHDNGNGAPGICNNNGGAAPGSNLRRSPNSDGTPNNDLTNVPVFRPNGTCPPTSAGNYVIADYNETYFGFRTDFNADYGGYGRPTDRRLGGAIPNNTIANQLIDERMARLCENLKAQGIIIYTITFNLTNVTTQNLYRACATAPEYYFNSPNQAALQAAFRTIGTQLVNLRLTR